MNQRAQVTSVNSKQEEFVESPVPKRVGIVIEVRGASKKTTETGEIDIPGYVKIKDTHRQIHTLSHTSFNANPGLKVDDVGELEYRLPSATAAKIMGSNNGLWFFTKKTREEVLGK